MKKTVLSAIALAMLAMPAFAEEPVDNSADGLLQAPQEKMHEKACCSEKKGANWIPTISGFIQLGGYEEATTYQKINDERPDADYYGTFTLNHARVTIKGAPAQWFDYRLQLEFASGAKIMDAEVKFHPLYKIEKGKDAFNIWLGQSKTPLSLENPYGPTNFEVIENAQVVKNLVGYNQYGFNNANTKFAGGRDLGAAIYGSALKVNWGGDEHKLFEYKLGVYNGAGMNINDIDKYKTLGGFLYLHPVKPLTIGGSFMAGKYEAPKVPTADDTKTEFGASYNRWAVSFKYDDGKHWNARAEYIAGATEQSKDANKDVEKLKSDGWYAMLNYTINPNPEKKNQWGVTLKYDGYRANVSDDKVMSVKDGSDVKLKENCTHRLAAGMNYWPLKWMYVQAVYTYTMYNKNFTVAEGNHKFQATCAVLF